MLGCETLEAHWGSEISPLAEKMSEGTVAPWHVAGHCKPTAGSLGEGGCLPVDTLGVKGPQCLACVLCVHTSYNVIYVYLK